jgi:hypothetical protein
MIVRLRSQSSAGLAVFLAVIRQHQHHENRDPSRSSSDSSMRDGLQSPVEAGGRELTAPDGDRLDGLAYDYL